MSDETRFKTETVKYGTNYCQHGVIICMPCQTCAYDALKSENEKLRTMFAKLVENWYGENCDGLAFTEHMDEARATLDESEGEK